MSDERGGEVFAAIRAACESIDGMLNTPSARMFHLLLTHQDGLVKGPMLEIGAYKGKSALLLAHHLQADERLDLIDIMPYLETDKFARWGDAVRLHLGDSEGLARLIPDYDRQRARYRFIHSDASHTFANVVNDIAHAERLLAPAGLLAVDDYENPNFPQVPLAVGASVYTKRSRLTPFVVVDNKAYLCRPAMRPRMLALVLNEIAPAFYRDYGLVLACTDADERAPLCLRHPEAGDEGAVYGAAVYDFQRGLAGSNDAMVPARLPQTWPFTLMALKPDFASVRTDVVAGFGKWRIWTREGWHDVKRRYRRTVLGPIWNTLSLAVLAFAMTYVWGPLMGADIPTFLPWVLSGVVCWSFLSTLINTSGYLYTSAESLLKQMRFPLTAIALGGLWRELIILGHNLIVVALVVLIFHVPVNLNTALFIPGVLLVAINALWFMPLLALLSTRFRDVPPLVSSVLTVLYFVTPVFWRPEQLAGRSFLYDVNYLHHLLDLVRSPLLGKTPEPVSYIVVIVSFLVGSAVTVLAYAYLRRRVTYWL